MSCALARNITSQRRGVTLLELLVAMTIAVIIIGGSVTAFIQMLRAHDRAQARIEATSNARSALESVSLEFRRGQTTNPLVMIFDANTSTGATLPGDVVDQDLDSSFDEELLDGADDDTDWALADDRHAIFTTGTTSYAERPLYYQATDLDDFHVDIDTQATSASVRFSTFDVPGDPVNRVVRFFVGTDSMGEPNSLIREVTGTDPATSTIVTISSPIAHNVVSFGLLYWDQALAQTSTQNPWRTSWSTDVSATSAPASVYMTIQTYAGYPRKLTELVPGERVETISMTSVVSIESVLADPRYIALKLPVNPIP